MWNTTTTTTVYNVLHGYMSARFYFQCLIGHMRALYASKHTHIHTTHSFKFRPFKGYIIRWLMLWILFPFKINTSNIYSAYLNVESVKTECTSQNVNNEIIEKNVLSKRLCSIVKQQIKDQSNHSMDGFYIYIFFFIHVLSYFEYSFLFIKRISLPIFGTFSIKQINELSLYFLNFLQCINATIVQRMVMECSFLYRFLDRFATDHQYFSFLERG